MKRQLAILVLAFVVVFGSTSVTLAQNATLNATPTQAQAQAQTSTNTNNNNLRNVNVVRNENEVGDITVASFNRNAQIQGRDVLLFRAIKNQINVIGEDFI